MIAETWLRIVFGASRSRRAIAAGQAGERCRLIDSQSVQGADTVRRDTCGYDAGKKVKGASGSSSPTPSVLRRGAEDDDGEQQAERGFAVVPRRWAVERTFAC